MTAVDDDNDDGFTSKVLMMARPKQPGILDLLGLPLGKPDATPREAAAPAAVPVPPRPEPEYSPPPKKSDPLPSPGDAYRACAAYLNRLAAGERLIHFVDKDCFSVGFCYSDLRRIRWAKGDKPGGGPVLWLRFIDAVITDVGINGRNLDDIRYYIGEGTMPWVWQQPDGFKARDDAMAVITGFTFTEKEK
jgi:hypothetical protein